MTIRIPPRAEGHAGGATPPVPPGIDEHRPIRRAAVAAGVGLLLMSVLAGTAKFVALDGLVTPGDAARTAADITGSDGTFRLGVMGLIVVIVLDVVVAWGLYRVFSPVSASVSMLAAAFRLVFAGVFLAAVGQLLGALRLLGNDAYLSVFSADQLHAQALLESLRSTICGSSRSACSASTCCSSATWRIGRGTRLGSSACCSSSPGWAT